MAVTLTITELDDTARLAEWSSDLGGTPTFYVYINAVLVETTTRTFLYFDVGPGEQVQVEVLDAVGTPARAFPGRILASWNAVADAAKYKVEENVATVWTRRAEILDRGEGYFEWQSRYLEDATTHQFRVTTIGSDGNEGPVHPVTIKMVRNPDPPSITYSYSSVSGKVTIS
jgi:hypothetical protein